MNTRNWSQTLLSALIIAVGIAMILLGRHLVMSHPGAIHDLRASFEMFSLLAFGGFVVCTGFVLLLAGWGEPRE